MPLSQTRSALRQCGEKHWCFACIHFSSGSPDKALGVGESRWDFAFRVLRSLVWAKYALFLNVKYIIIYTVYLPRRIIMFPIQLAGDQCRKDTK